MKKIQKRHKSGLAFEIKSKDGSLIKTTKFYWNIITHIKHPSIQGKEKQVKDTIASPDEIRSSKKDKDVYLFYKKYRDRFLCIVTRTYENRGFIITAYYTKKIKEGELKWRK